MDSTSVVALYCWALFKYEFQSHNVSILKFFLRQKIETKKYLMVRNAQNVSHIHDFLKIFLLIDDPVCMIEDCQLQTRLQLLSLLSSSLRNQKPKMKTGNLEESLRYNPNAPPTTTTPNFSKQINRHF